ncbi:MAG: DUF4091 domain-containing protein [Victivallaceae bacterium]|nr:DUF4091 domain-containing protein [Victivallaceae bacterium]
MIIRPVHSLNKVFADAATLPEPLPGDLAARGERYSFQIVLAPERGDEAGRYHVSVDSRLPTRVRSVEFVPVLLAADDPDEFILRGTAGLYPDLLRELEPGAVFCVTMNVKKTLWVTVEIPPGSKPGSYDIEFEFTRFKYPDEWLPQPYGRVKFTLEVLDFELPTCDFRRLEWLHCDCLAAVYHVAAWSEEHWRIVENFIRNAARHGVNVLYTPLWTPPLDTVFNGSRPNCQLLAIDYDAKADEYKFDFSRVERYIKLGLASGMTRFAMSHFFSQWGAEFTPAIEVMVDGVMEKKFGWHVKSDSPEYRHFLVALMPKLLAFLRGLGVEKKCYFSVSDEPDAEKPAGYCAAAELMHSLLDGAPTLEALSNYDFYRRGLVSIPVPLSTKIDAFLGKTSENWSYYCSCPGHLASNRFIAMPSLQTRVMGVQWFRYDLNGFLHWGYNFYYSQLSRRVIDPYAETDAGGAFPAGDPFIVYPGRSGEPEDSIRGEVFFDGLQDMRALRAYEHKYGREAALSVIGAEVTMTQFPRTDRWLCDLRELVYRKLAGS